LGVNILHARFIFPIFFDLILYFTGFRLPK